MAKTRAGFMAACERYLDTHENPIGGGFNNSPVNYEYGAVGPAWPWCAMTMWLALTHAGFSVPKTASVWQFKTWAQNNEYGLKWISNADAIPGDMFVFFNHSHIGMVASRLGAGFTSVEGNWGDRCCRVTRANWGSIEGCIRLPFVDAIPSSTPMPPVVVNGTEHYADPNKQQAGDEGNLVRMLQTRLNNIRGVLLYSGQKAWDALVVDGQFGPATGGAVGAFQAHFGIPMNGVNDWLTAGKMGQVEAFCGIHYWG